MDIDAHLGTLITQDDYVTDEILKKLKISEKDIKKYLTDSMMLSDGILTKAEVQALRTFIDASVNGAFFEVFGMTTMSPVVAGTIDPIVDSLLINVIDKDILNLERQLVIQGLVADFNNTWIPFAGMTVSDMVAVQAGSLSKRTSGVIITGVQAGDTYKEISTKVNATLGLAGKPGTTDTLVRTYISQLNTESQSSILKKDEELQCITYSVISDGRTTDICKSKVGVRICKNTSETSNDFLTRMDASGQLPPLHHRCRTIYIPQYV